MTSGKPDGLFTGFGFGAIQAGLFTLEALRKNAFEQVAVCEISESLVERVRQNGGLFTVNVAHENGIETVELGPVEILNPNSEADRELIVERLARSSEAATAVPSVDIYTAGGAGSIRGLLAEALRSERETPLMVYTAENNNRAAEILEEAVRAEAGLPQRLFDERISFVNTVIGKMSGIISNPEEITARGIAPLTPGHDSAILVEEFNRILVSTPSGDHAADWRPAFTSFETRRELLPYEEAKLYGHNGVHAMGSYLASLLGKTRMDELGLVPGAVAFLERALVDEAGAALLRRHAGIDDLFTPEGFAEYAAELIPRMLNPHLGDLVARVARDPERKLGWNDRLVGTLRLGIETGVDMPRFAIAAAAALRYLAPSAADPATTLECIWKKDSPPAKEAAVICALIEAAHEKLSRTRVEDLFTSPEVFDS